MPVHCLRSAVACTKVKTDIESLFVHTVYYICELCIESTVGGFFSSFRCWEKQIENLCVNKFGSFWLQFRICNPFSYGFVGCAMEDTVFNLAGEMNRERQRASLDCDAAIMQTRSLRACKGCVSEPEHNVIYRYSDCVDQTAKFHFKNFMNLWDSYKNLNWEWMAAREHWWNSARKPWCVGCAYRWALLFGYFGMGLNWICYISGRAHTRKS